METGLVHAYTGSGKGKTTCAFGLAVRCAGNGGKVKIIQFLKTVESGEVSFCSDVKNIEVYRFERSHGFVFEMSDDEKSALKKQIDDGIEFAKRCIFEKNCDMLVLDEILCAWQLGFVSEEELFCLTEKNSGIEVVLTGHSMPEKLSKRCDYITEMKKIKHPYDKNICARKGVEY